MDFKKKKMGTAEMYHLNKPFRILHIISLNKIQKLSRDPTPTADKVEMD